MKLPHLFVTAAVAAVVFAAPAGAQDNRFMIDRMERLERDLQTLQMQVYRGGGAGSSTVITSPALGGGTASPPPRPPMELPADTAGRLDVRLDSLEEQIRQLTGKVEESQFRTRQVKEQLDRMQADVDIRFRELQQGGGATAAVAPPPPAADDTPPGSAKEGVLGSMPKRDLDRETANKPPPPPEKFQLKGNTPKEQYDFAYNLVMKDRNQAEQAFRAFLQAHPADPLAGSAYYWLGETHFARGDYKQAAVSFLDGYRKFPKGPKGAHNLLKLGQSMARMDDAKGACAALIRLGNEYPDADPAVKRAAQSERQKLKCS